MIRAIRHAGLVVTDLNRALHFWCDVLGFKLIKRMDESGPQIDAMLNLRDVRLTTAKLAAVDGSQIELLKFHSHPDKSSWSGTPYSTGFTHIALTVRGMDEVVKHLKQHGVIFPNPPQHSVDGKVVVTYAQAFEGVLLELVEVLE
ncbi:MAG: VOC family protein [Gammaproteobacteria bacterium]|nr:VOC family protein [Gammaproteobacteria bacterium]MBU0788300.1 VOC family protein [Gammaproteobacteria bacterium]MBU0815203.1 VOC family protein [Gammaproteobacteria bacterium]MBU1785689.1 VOC family protein [Gammaproteobacteria bacterium]